MNCLGCGCDLKPAPTRKKLGAKKFCNTSCQMLAQRNERHRKFLAGGYVGEELNFPAESWPRLLLIEHFGYKCNSCSIDSWNGQSITLEVNHKDGKSSNNVMSNLEFLCPNCHSQTDTYRALNKNNATRTGRNKNFLPV